MSNEDSGQFSQQVPGMTPSGWRRAADADLVWQPPTVEHLQSLLPQFEILSLLGQGGMGAVYKARQITLNRLVAIKLLPPNPSEDGDAGLVERFKNEARTMAMFMHPAIVAVFDSGETAEGQPYFIMEFVEGTDVHKLITSQGRLTADYAIGITAHVCDALQYAHSRGVIHRDIKPANVLINMEGQVKVADFGLAKMGGTHAGGDEATVTMGTPDYIAPEALIVGVELDHRADLFSVGVMLYNMLTGEIPRVKYEPASRCAGCDVRYDAIVARALQPDRARRYQSALEIRRDLDKILATPVLKESAPKNATGPKPRSPRVPAHAPVPVRNSQFSWLISAVLTMLIASAAVWFFISRPAGQGLTGDTAPAANQASSDTTSPALETSAAGMLPASGGRRDEDPISAPSAPNMGLVTSPPAPPVLSAELAELVTQFQKLQRERVTASFDESIARLNTGYLGGLDRESANEKSAGNPDAMLALEEEKKLVQAAGPARLDTMGPVVASAEEDKSQGALKKLRGIYRLEMAKLDAQRASNEAALRTSFLARLKQLEIDLTKAGRLTDAKAVMDYREGLAAGVPVASGAPTAARRAKPSETTMQDTLNDLANVKVDDITMSPLIKDQLLFSDRNKMSFKEPPAKFRGCQFTQTKAHAATLHFKVLSDGLVYMACTTRMIGPWAAEAPSWSMPATSLDQLKKDGWQLLEGTSLPTTTDFNWNVFSRQCKAGEEFSYRTEKYAPPILLLK